MGAVGRVVRIGTVRNCVNTAVSESTKTGLGKTCAQQQKQSSSRGASRSLGRFSGFVGDAAMASLSSRESAETIALLRSRVSLR